MKSLILLLFTLTAQAAGPEHPPVKIPAPKPKQNPCPTLDLFKAIATKDKACLAQAIRFMDPNTPNREGDTPLHLAIRTKNREAINFLIQNGTDLNQRNYSQQTPKELAESYGYRKLADYIDNIERETIRLIEAVEYNDLAAAKASILRGASLSTTDTRLDTPLHRAAQSNLPEMVKLLVHYKAKIEARNYLGETPLHSAALRDFTETMQALIAAGADASALNFRRETPLDIAGLRENPEILAMLTKKKARRGSRADVNVEVSGGDGEGPNSSQ